MKRYDRNKKWNHQNFKPTYQKTFNLEKEISFLKNPNLNWLNYCQKNNLK